MIARLKNSSFGKLLYRASRRPGGQPLARAATLVQNQKFNPAHLTPGHRRHNARQARILRAFETGGRAQK